MKDNSTAVQLQTGQSHTPSTPSATHTPPQVLYESAIQEAIEKAKNKLFEESEAIHNRRRNELMKYEEDLECKRKECELRQIKLDRDTERKTYEAKLKALQTKIEAMEQCTGVSAQLQRNESPFGNDTAAASQDHDVIQSSVYNMISNTRRSPRYHASSRRFDLTLQQDNNQKTQRMLQHANSFVQPKGISDGITHMMNSSPHILLASTPQNKTTPSTSVKRTSANEANSDNTSSYADAIDEMFSFKRQRSNSISTVHNDVIQGSISDLKSLATSKQEKARRLNDILRESMKLENKIKIKTQLDQHNVEAKLIPKPRPNDTFNYNCSLYFPNITEDDPDSRASIIRNELLHFVASNYTNFTEVLINLGVYCLVVNNNRLLIFLWLIDFPQVYSLTEITKSFWYSLITIILSITTMAGLDEDYLRRTRFGPFRLDVSAFQKYNSCRWPLRHSNGSLHEERHNDSISHRLLAC